MSAISWLSVREPLECRVCGFTGIGERVAEITALAEIRLPAVRCPDCASIQLRDEALDSSPTDASIDGYVEAGVGIGAIAASLSLADLSGVRSFLDVGCNYGFALDLGRFLYGWSVVGVEPSLAGIRGAAELGLDIRNEYLTGESQVGEGYDLIFASEVVEHVTDPVGFLRAIAERLSATGQAVLTTPAADYIDAENPEAEVLAAISPGYHVFLASAEGLELLLRRAGFRSVTVERDRGSLRAVASLAEESSTAASKPISMVELERYYAHAARRAPRGSALALGMAVRHLRSRVARGDFARIRPIISLVTTLFRKRHGLALSAPEAVTSAILAEGSAPWSLAGAAFALGMVQLSSRADPQLASQYFRLAAISAKTWRAAAQVADLDTVDLLFQAAYHRALALARFDAPTAESEVLLLGDWVDDGNPQRTTMLAARECRVYVEIAARGGSVGNELLARVTASMLALSADPEIENRKSGLDALFSVALDHAQAGDTVTAAELLEKCRVLALASGGDHGAALAASCAVQVARIDGEVLDRPTRTVHSALDTYWCDAYGTYVDGWVHLDELALQTITVSMGQQTVVASRSERPDLLNHWPQHPTVAAGGFAAYVPGTPTGNVVVRIDTPAGRYSTTIELPPHPLPVLEALPRAEDVLARALEIAPPGEVLAIGLRSPTEKLGIERLAEFAPREVTSLDIHAGFGVTLVGDAHRMSEFLPANHFALVVSADVLEHVTTPWLFARECARVLAVGGLAVHIAPWVWPTHAQPSDFYRFSPEGLGHLFGPDLGFRVIATGGHDAARVLPAPVWRHGFMLMPTTDSGSHSWIIAEKISDIATEIEWPYAASDAAQDYPLDGLAPETSRP